LGSWMGRMILAGGGVFWNGPQKAGGGGAKISLWSKRLAGGGGVLGPSGLGGTTGGGGNGTGGGGGGRGGKLFSGEKGDFQDVNGRGQGLGLVVVPRAGNPGKKKKKKTQVPRKSAKTKGGLLGIFPGGWNGGRKRN